MHILLLFAYLVFVCAASYLNCQLSASVSVSVTASFSVCAYVCVSVSISSFVTQLWFWVWTLWLEHCWCNLRACLKYQLGIFPMSFVALACKPFPIGTGQATTKQTTRRSRSGAKYLLERCCGTYTALTALLQLNSLLVVPHTHNIMPPAFLWADLLKFCPQISRRPEHSTALLSRSYIACLCESSGKRNVDAGVCADVGCRLTLAANVCSRCVFVCAFAWIRRGSRCLAGLSQKQAIIPCTLL